MQRAIQYRRSEKSDDGTSFLGRRASRENLSSDDHRPTGSRSGQEQLTLRDSSGASPRGGGPSHLATNQISFGRSRGNAAELREPVEVWTEPVSLQLEFPDTIRRSTLPPALGSAPCELAFGLSYQLCLGSERRIGLKPGQPAAALLQLSSILICSSRELSVLIRSLFLV